MSIRKLARRVIAGAWALAAIAWVLFAIFGGALINPAGGLTIGALAITAVCAHQAIKGDTWEPR